ncbi:CS1 type fimbrial major subunit [Serratia fonticola]|uniref:CS1 type fimbrial major subunit n=1 Tax=Serratia fonticola TaxID=47917 RepID=A0ABY9PT92_SERFO|nr:CS1 type fimbrial major subunit [Serratia fonticola]WMT16662.1 CS1 type fimbrial major subunit [Serratia fonticola]
MKKILLSVVAAAILSSGVAHAADGVKKEITIVANINDAIFVSKPDGSTWYDKEELFAKDYTQTEFASNDLPVRVYTTDNEVNVSLVQPLVVSRADGAQLSGISINFAGKAVVQGTPLKVMQTTTAPGGYDNTYTLKINAKAPTNATGSTNGAYQGDLVMLFEPKA